VIYFIHCLEEKKTVLLQILGHATRSISRNTSLKR